MAYEDELKFLDQIGGWRSVGGVGARYGEGYGYGSGSESEKLTEWISKAKIVIIGLVASLVCLISKRLIV